VTCNVISSASMHKLIKFLIIHKITFTVQIIHIMQYYKSFIATHHYLNRVNTHDYNLRPQTWCISMYYSIYNYTVFALKHRKS
jgi:hypothetical protein